MAKFFQKNKCTNFIVFIIHRFLLLEPLFVGDPGVVGARRRRRAALAQRLLLPTGNGRYRLLETLGRISQVVRTPSLVLLVHVVELELELFVGDLRVHDGQCVDPHPPAAVLVFDGMVEQHPEQGVNLQKQHFTVKETISLCLRLVPCSSTWCRWNETSFLYWISFLKRKSKLIARCP